MKHIKLGLLILLMACKPNLGNKKIQEDSLVLSLNNRAVELASFQNADSTKLSIELLDSAIEIQPDHFNSHYSKLICQNELGLKSEAAVTAQIVSELKPNNPVLMMNSGLLKELIGDTTLTQNKYLKSKIIFENILDTISENSISYDMFRFFYAVNLRLLYQKNASDSIFKIISQDTAPNYDYYRQKAINYPSMNRNKILLDYAENE